MPAMTRRKFPTVDLSTVPPIEFELGGDVFRVPRRLPVEQLELLGSVMVNDQGKRIYAAAQVIPALRRAMAKELFLPWPDDDVPAEGEDPRGRWVAVDDERRFAALISSDRVSIEIKTLAEMAMFIVEEATTHPFGEPSPS